jgi:hypothetical protein
LKTILALVSVLTIALMTLFLLDHEGIPLTPHDRAVERLLARNLAARGGAEAWKSVSSLELRGQMDLGQGMHVPYVLDQKRPDKMCLEYSFDEETAIQCTDGKTGWKVAPFLGRSTPEAMTESEVRETAESADPFGLLYEHGARGHDVELIGEEPVEGRNTFKLEVTLPGGAVRWIYLDAESALEVKLEAVRTLAGHAQRIETFYRDWMSAEGLVIPRRQETRAVGSGDLHFLTVESVKVNPPIDDARFASPVAGTADSGHGAPSRTDSTILGEDLTSRSNG